MPTPPNEHPKLKPSCKGCEQRNERCHINCEKYKVYCETLEDFKAFAKEQDTRLVSTISSLQNSNCRRKAWK